jgi:phosphoribosylformimino-5-aminoimidazole carboxamide ribotide isomerase
MKILPAIDLINGEAVRLYKGDYDKKTVYSNDPVSVAKGFKNAGSRWLHLVDLDGAKGEKRQLEIISRIVKESDLDVQVGGGIKTIDDVKSLLELGVKKVVIGTVAVKNPDLVKEIISDVGADKITLALDVLGGESAETLEEFSVATHGWQQKSSRSLCEMIETYKEFDGLNYLITDVSKDGTLQGPNFKMYGLLRENFPSLRVLVSGGVASLEDLTQSKSLTVEGVIIGKAIYDDRFSVEQAVEFQGDRDVK